MIAKELPKKLRIAKISGRLAMLPGIGKPETINNFEEWKKLEVNLDARFLEDIVAAQGASHTHNCMLWGKVAVKIPIPAVCNPWYV